MSTDTELQGRPARMEEMRRRKEQKHTPGPWFVTGTRVFHETADAEPAIAETGGAIDSSVDESKAEANAKLIAAAPELLDALRVLADHAQEKYPHFESERGQADIKAALDAIAKAEGCQ